MHTRACAALSLLLARSRVIHRACSRAFVCTSVHVRLSLSLARSLAHSLSCYARGVLSCTRFHTRTRAREHPEQRDKKRYTDTQSSMCGTPRAVCAEHAREHPQRRTHTPAEQRSHQCQVVYVRHTHTPAEQRSHQCQVVYVRHTHTRAEQRSHQCQVRWRTAGTERM